MKKRKAAQKPRRATEKPRRIIAYIATSADGYIARPDGNVDWLNRPMPKGQYGMGDFFKTIDTILWGRKTYVEAVERGMKATGYGSGIRNYVFSRTPQKSSTQSVEFVSPSIKSFAQELRARAGKDIWMMGGASIIASFLDEGEIDEFIVHVIPVFIGEGIPLVQPRHRSIPLELLSAKTFPDGVVRLNYRVGSPPDAG